MKYRYWFFIFSILFSTQTIAGGRAGYHHIPTLSAQKTGGFLQGDFTFERYQLDLRRYQPLARGAHCRHAPQTRHRTWQPPQPIPLRPWRFRFSTRIRFQNLHR
ncbi:MAG: hypothetical protein HN521_07065 [Candidatus Latescibacteria bacterium]|nr:hypothetical protein [Candidatus Latescibacterota bacterium]